ncbi:MAG: hypothetical protein IJ261_04645 [Clostridia bacterium]|nr:hypothetical protein [Clostridia bacterium]
MSDWKYDPDASTSALLEGARQSLYKSGDFPAHFYSKEKKMKRSGAIRRAIGVVLIIAAVAVLILLDRNSWVDCILPSVLFGVGLALYKSYPYVSMKKVDVYVYKEDVAKGLLGGMFGLFAVLVVICYAGIFMEKFFGV